VNVDRFLCFTAEKEESVSLMSENFWHELRISGTGCEESGNFSANVSEQERREERPRKSKQPIFPPFPASPC